MKEIRLYVTLEELFPSFDLASIQSLVNDETKSKQTFDVKFANVINILADQYQDWYVGYVDKWFVPGMEIVITNDEAETIGVKFLRKLMVKYNFTKDRYLTLLDLYDNQKSHLMDQLEAVSIANGGRRFNDTPQDAGTGHSNFEDDDHTTTWEGTNNTITTTSDPMTIMARIDEIQKMYRNVLEDWCKEFQQLFIAPHDEFEVEFEPEGE